MTFCCYGRPSGMGMQLHGTGTMIPVDTGFTGVARGESWTVQAVVRGSARMGGKTVQAWPVAHVQEVRKAWLAVAWVAAGIRGSRSPAARRVGALC